MNKEEVQKDINESNINLIAYMLARKEVLCEDNAFAWIINEYMDSRLEQADKKIDYHNIPSLVRWKQIKDKEEQEWKWVRVSGRLAFELSEAGGLVVNAFDHYYFGYPKTEKPLEETEVFKKAALIHIKDFLIY